MDIEQELRRMLLARPESLKYLTEAIGQIAKNECSKMIRKLLESEQAYIGIDWRVYLKKDI